MKTIHDQHKEIMKPLEPEPMQLHLDQNISWENRRNIAKNYQFYLNKDFISDVLDADNSKIVPVENDW